jgi:hypothetical protein
MGRAAPSTLTSGRTLDRLKCLFVARLCPSEPTLSTTEIRLILLKKVEVGIAGLWIATAGNGVEGDDGAGLRSGRRQRHRRGDQCRQFAGVLRGRGH